MTCIAWDGKSLAAERLLTEGDLVFGYEKKILKYNEGVWSSRGSVLDGVCFQQWLNGEIKSWKAGKDFEGLFVKDKRVYYVDKKLVPWDVTDHKLAIGSGGPTAQVVLNEGYTAKEAVKVACQQVTSCGGKIDVVNVKP